jgi:hypothetical protein
LKPDSQKSYLEQAKVSRLFDFEYLLINRTPLLARPTPLPLPPSPTPRRPGPSLLVTPSPEIRTRTPVVSLTRPRYVYRHQSCSNTDNVGRPRHEQQQRRQHQQEPLNGMLFLEDKPKNQCASNFVEAAMYHVKQYRGASRCSFIVGLKNMMMPI